MSLAVRIEQLAHAHDLPLPDYASLGAAGLDLLAAIAEPIVLPPGERILLPTGLRIALPQGFEAQIRARSGLALKQGVIVVNAPGTVDSDYRGEVKVILGNLGNLDVVIERGMRIAQMVVAEVTRIHWQIDKVGIDETKRGVGGLGSTGLGMTTNGVDGGNA